MWHLSLLCVSLLAAAAVLASSEGSIFDFEAYDITGKHLKLSEMKGKKAYLVVNVASK
jgi:hypothetical protein